MFLKDGARQQVVIGTLLFCLLFVKITAFVTGVLLVGYAVVSRRIGFWRTSATAVVCLVAIGFVELASGLVSAYGYNVLQLANLNEATFGLRIWAYAGNHLDIFVPAVLAAALLANSAVAATGISNLRLPQILDSEAAWLIVALAAAYVFEIQNTGNLEYIYVWPVVLLALQRMNREAAGQHGIVVILLAALCLPTAVNYLQRAAQTFAASLSYTRLAAPALGPLAQVSARPIFVQRASALSQHYAQNREAYRKLAQKGLDHSDILSAEPDFQAGWLVNASDAIVALRAFEANTGRRFDSVYTLDFTDPFSFALGREPIRFVPIGVDVLRTLPRNDPRMLRSIAAATAILLPLCPLTSMREELARRMAPALEGRQRISLTPCYDLLVRQGSDFAARQ